MKNCNISKHAEMFDSLSREEQERYLREEIDGKTTLNENANDIQNFALDLGTETLEDYKRRKKLMTHQEFENKINSMFLGR